MCVFSLQVLLSAPANISDKYKSQFMDILVNNFHIKGANIINQTLLALYAYGSMSGIVVDIGERIEILPVTDGQFLFSSHYISFLVISIFYPLTFSFHGVGEASPT